jgi:hypothetical protein
MSQAAEAHDSWADVPDPTIRRRRREVDSWASAEELEILGGLGEERVADWSVLTLERGEPVADGVGRFDRAPAPAGAELVELAPAVVPEPAAVLALEPEPIAPGAPIARRPGERRTVVIRGQVAPRPLPAADRRRPSRRPHERVGPRPDRVAMWAVGLGLLLILVAILSAGASG